MMLPYPLAKVCNYVIIYSMFTRNRRNPNRRPGSRKFYWPLIMMLMLFIPILQVATGRRTVATVQDIVVQPTGVRLVAQRKSQPDIDLPFGSSIDTIRTLLGQESLLDAHLLVYASMGLSLYVDPLDGLQIIAYFGDGHALNPSSVASVWDVQGVRIDAGFFGNTLSQVQRRLREHQDIQLASEDELRFWVYGNTLRIAADTRGRVGMIAYHQGAFVPPAASDTSFIESQTLA
ncbi:hypothetical protein PVA44_06745 (plasmid) [Entomospira nematocerorum]|uniref:Uncharacterized protein n=1 Tax=Entomospira nematocerorum TaxID=2719987 RepID=A0A968GDQ8_9SPIO|nr:hypothetical protein [Entomospira nematocera]NIZ47603.1 hypothetical protein [Entomospira nematocera]WDI34607.1 hypothetical protein PVA44_06745 [Entomospira nematocera]